MTSTPLPIIHILRHGESLHNVQRGYQYRDPPLTPAGEEAAKLITLPDSVNPDIILVSPMTRTIQTALHAFPSLLALSGPKLQICPDLREAHDAECNKGVGRQELIAKFPQLPSSIFDSLPTEWNYPDHSIEAAQQRAERVRQMLKDLGSQGHKHIVIVTHRCIAAFLVQGLRFQPSELRSFEFAAPSQIEELRMGNHCETGVTQDYGPTLLIPWQGSSSRSQKTGVAKDEAAETPRPILMLLNGFPGIGKLTIAKALLALLSTTLPPTKLKLIDNHSVIDIVLLTCVKHSPAYYEARKSVLRSEFFDKISKEEEGGMVVLMTSVFAEDGNGVEQWRDHVALVRERGWGFVYVNLACEAGVNAERLVSEERVKGRELPGGKKKQILPWRLEELRSSQVMIDPKDHADELRDIVHYSYELDVTHLSADESAAKLRDILKQCRGSLDMSLN